jgi:hypothetical protein
MDALKPFWASKAIQMHYYFKYSTLHTLLYRHYFIYATSSLLPFFKSTNLSGCNDALVLRLMQVHQGVLALLLRQDSFGANVAPI